MKQLFLPFVSLVLVVSAYQGRSQVEYVDPAIGGVSMFLVPTRPTVHLPNSMVRVYPMRQDQLDELMKPFPLTIISHRLGELFSIMPDACGAAAAWDQEVARPYSYSVRFPDAMIRAEFTPAERCGYFRFHFPTNQASVVLANRLPGNWTVQESGIVSGEESFKGMKAYVYGVFGAPVKIKPESRGDKTQMVVTAETKILEFRYGISFISVEQARNNLEREIPAWGFEKIKTQAKAIWNQRLGQIRVSGGTEAQRRVFYTALYRCSERMVNISEYDRYYSAYDHRVHEDARPFYVDNWLWDTFRALEPLETILHPQRQADKIQSYVRMYEQSGWMPTFAVLWGNHACMNGNHAAIWFADAWFKGVRDFDLPSGYAGLKKNSLEGTKLPWRSGPKCKLDDFYNEHGYFPSLKPGEPETEPMVDGFEKRQPVAVTMENSYDDWAIAQLAGPAGKPEDRDLFLKRAQFYKNVFRPEKKLAWPKDAAGNWIEPLNPKLDGGPGYRDYYDENNGWTYTWNAPHDYEGLFDLMGGREKALANLEQLFREPLGIKRNLFYVDGANSTGMVGQFSMGNEPSLPIPYLFNRLGAPWKTQQRVRTLLAAFFTDGYSGIPGDEDGGGLSAFVVFSMMGFYPVTPGLPVYDVGSPVFEKTVITLQNGKTFRIIAKGASRQNQYVQSIRLNGKPLDRVWFRHADIVNGGTLELIMGDTPNRTLGVEPSTFPPASLASDQAAFRPLTSNRKGTRSGKETMKPNTAL